MAASLGQESVRRLGGSRVRREGTKNVRWFNPQGPLPVIRGTIVLTPFPFSNLTGATDLLLSPSHPDWRGTGLKVPSDITCDKLATVHRRIILGELGAFAGSLVGELNARLRLALDL
jgi:mRNA-degrading endonuclease toxin of MazEF toxin-antitoxin module